MTEKKIVIVTDSTAHMPESACKGLDIVTIPVWLIWNEERYRDNVDIDSPTFYERLKSSKTLPSTSQPTPAEFMTLFEKLSEKFDSIVAVLVSGEISGTVASAVMAKKELPHLDIHVIDTLQAAMGSGMAALTAARAALDGKSVKEVAHPRVCRARYARVSAPRRAHRWSQTPAGFRAENKTAFAFS